MYICSHIYVYLHIVLCLETIAKIKRKKVIILNNKKKEEIETRVKKRYYSFSIILCINICISFMLVLIMWLAFFTPHIRCLQVHKHHIYVYEG